MQEGVQSSLSVQTENCICTLLRVGLSNHLLLHRVAPCSKTLHTAREQCFRMKDVVSCKEGAALLV